jgi:subtilisin family serine protease
MKMIGATPDGRGRRQGQGRHRRRHRHRHRPSSDLAPNFDWELSRNFVTDIPDVDGPCEYADCKDPVGVDDGAHGTHVAGTIAAAVNGLGISGVAPEATLVEIRAGQDSGYFFLQPTVDALVYAGDAGIDVVNMSFYADPWLFNCASEADYVDGSTEGIEEQAIIRAALIEAIDYAHANGVTMIAAAGNGATD